MNVLYFDWKVFLEIKTTADYVITKSWSKVFFLFWAGPTSLIGKIPPVAFKHLKFMGVYIGPY